MIKNKTMKTINSILAGLLLTASVLLTQQATAQAPQKMSYQSVLRNSSNVLLVNTAVGIKISVLQGNATGTPVYVETQTATTNANGLVSLQIGLGTATTGTFAGIDWSAGPYFIKTETDPLGGTNYTITGTQEMLSVPYAMYAARSGGTFFKPTEDFGFPGSIHNTNAGNVGIGTDLPREKLEVFGGNLKVSQDVIIAGNNLIGGDSMTAGNSIVGQNLEVNGSATIVSITIPGGDPAQGKVLTSNDIGVATWEMPAPSVFEPTIDMPDAIHNTNSGNVGIGTDLPSAKLDVAGDIRIRGGNPAQGKVLTSDDNGSATWQTPNISTTTIGTIGDSPTANGGTIESGVLRLTQADRNNGGVVTNSTQDFDGNKTFYGNLKINNFGSSSKKVNIYNNNNTFTDPIGTNLNIEGGLSYAAIPSGNYPLYSTADINPGIPDYIANSAVTFDNLTALHLTSPRNYFYNNTSNWWALLTDGDVKVNGKVNTSGTYTGAGFKTPNGQANEYLMADGSVSAGSLGSNSFETTADDATAIHNTNAGNVGIGTDLPSEKLDVAGNLKVRNNATVIGNLGIRTSDPVTNFQLNDKVVDDGQFPYDTNTAYLVHPTPTSSTVLNDPKTLLLLARQGTSGEAYGAGAAFNLSRYEDNGAGSRTRLDFNLANENFMQDATNVMTLLSNGNVGIGNTAPSEKIEVTGNVKASSFVKTGGVSSQYLMADGSTSPRTALGPVGGTSTSNGATLTNGTLSLAPADATNSGIITPFTQTFGGDKKFTQSVSANSFVKTGGVSSQYLMADGSTSPRIALGPVVGTSTANGATLTNGTLSLAPADATNSGIITPFMQTFGGDKTFTQSVSASSFVKTGGVSSQYLMADGSTSPRIALGPVVGTSTANGATLTNGTLSLAPADATNSGIITPFIQTFGGDKTFTQSVSAISFVKTGGVSSQYLMADGSTSPRISLGPVGGTSTSNGATLTNGTLSLAPADATNSGIVTTGAQTFAGSKTFSSAIKITAGTPGAGKILTSDASGLASWQSASPCGYAIGQNVTALGGIIFYLDASGCHGLVCAPTDQSTGIRWHNGSYPNTTAFADCVGGGAGNTSMIIYNQGATATSYAAGLARAYGSSYANWYLPCKYELDLMYLNIGQGNVLGLGNVGGFASSYYWSSSESDQYDGKVKNFSDGGTLYFNKNNTIYVRAVRAF